MSSIQPMSVSIEKASNFYGVSLKTSVYLTYSVSALLIFDKIKRVLGAIGTFQIKKEIYDQRAEKDVSNKGDGQKAYFKRSKEDYNAAIDAMNNVFAETEIFDSSYKNIAKISEPKMSEDPLFIKLLAQEPNADKAAQEKIMALVEEFRETGLYDEALYGKKKNDEDAKDQIQALCDQIEDPWAARYANYIKEMGYKLD